MARWVPLKLEPDYCAWKEGEALLGHFKGFVEISVSSRRIIIETKKGTVEKYSTAQLWRYLKSVPVGTLIRIECHGKDRNEDTNNVLTWIFQVWRWEE